MKLGYTTLYVPSVQTNVEFYDRAFGIERRFIQESGQYAEMETGATALAFVDEKMMMSTFYNFRRNRRTEYPPGVEVGFVSDDVKRAFDRAVNSGATPVLAPTKKPWGQIVGYVRDCNGFLIEICSEVGPSLVSQQTQANR